MALQCCQQLPLSHALAVQHPAALPAHLPIRPGLEPLETRQRQLPSTTFTNHSSYIFDKNLQNPFILIETTSLMLWLSAFPCEQAPSKSPHPHHQSFQDFNQNEGKNTALLKNQLRTVIIPSLLLSSREELTMFLSPPGRLFLPMPVCIASVGGEMGGRYFYC